MEHLIGIIVEFYLNNEWAFILFYSFLFLLTLVGIEFYNFIVKQLKK